MRRGRLPLNETSHDKKIIPISGFAEDTHARKNSNKIWFFTHLIVSLQRETKDFMAF